MKYMVIVLNEITGEVKIHDTGLTNNEKERLFDTLDNQLHDTTYNELENMADDLRLKCEDLIQGNENYKGIIEEMQCHRRTYAGY